MRLYFSPNLLCLWCSETRSSGCCSTAAVYRSCKKKTLAQRIRYTFRRNFVEPATGFLESYWPILPSTTISWSTQQRMLNKSMVTQTLPHICQTKTLLTCFLTMQEETQNRGSKWHQLVQTLEQPLCYSGSIPALRPGSKVFHRCSYFAGPSDINPQISRIGSTIHQLPSLPPGINLHNIYSLIMAEAAALSLAARLASLLNSEITNYLTDYQNVVTYLKQFRWFGMSTTRELNTQVCLSSLW